MADNFHSCILTGCNITGRCNINSKQT